MEFYRRKGKFHWQFISHLQQQLIINQLNFVEEIPRNCRKVLESFVYQEKRMIHSSRAIITTKNVHIAAKISSVRYMLLTILCIARFEIGSRSARTAHGVRDDFGREKNNKAAAVRVVARESSVLEYFPPKKNRKESSAEIFASRRFIKLSF